MVAWLKVAPVQRAVVWHCRQSVENPRRHVAGVGGAVEVRLVTGHARPREPGEHVVQVAIGTRQPHVGAVDGESGDGVVEVAAAPAACAVAVFARGGQARAGVLGIGGAVVVALVTGYARGRQPREHAPHMTVLTGGAGVHAGQRERRLVVIEAGPVPRLLVVAAGAILTVAGGRMVGTGGLVVVRHVTGGTVRGGIDVAQRTGRGQAVTHLAIERLVRTRQREARQTVHADLVVAVDETARAVTACAVAPQLRVVDVGVAVHAGGGRHFEVEAGVAPRAGHRSVGALQRDPVFFVVELLADFGRLPAVRAVAERAVLLVVPVRVLHVGLCTRLSHHRQRAVRAPCEQRKHGHESDSHQQKKLVIATVHCDHL